MTYASFTRVTFGGKNLVLPGEQWSCNVSVVEPVGDFGSLSNPDAYLAAIRTALGTWFQSAAALIPTTFTLEYVKANGILPNGSYEDKTVTHEWFYSPILAGTATVVGSLPPILSVAYSWTTAKMRGPGSHGRIYPPNTAQTISPNGALTIAGANITQDVAAAKALLTALASAGATAATPVIASKVGSGSVTPITGVRVGNVVDVQRRRKSAIPETYTSAVWP